MHLNNKYYVLNYQKLCQHPKTWNLRTKFKDCGRPKNLSFDALNKIWYIVETNERENAISGFCKSYSATHPQWKKLMEICVPSKVEVAAILQTVDFHARRNNQLLWQLSIVVYRIPNRCYILCLQLRFGTIGRNSWEFFRVTWAYQKIRSVLLQYRAVVVQKTYRDDWAHPSLRYR